MAINEPTVVVLPGSGDVPEHPPEETVELASTIQSALYDKTHPKPEPKLQPKPEHTNEGPLKQALAHSDSLYAYINWEKPSRTLGTYFSALGLLFGAHYLPLSQWALKGTATTLGVVSITEFVSRLVTSQSMSARLRPQRYQKVPEPTLNATLKDVHDLIQYTVIQAQRIIYGQDLDKTVATFLGATLLYWLIQILSPFWLAVAGLTSIFIAPLVNSPQGRRAAQEASVRAQELANTTAEKSRELAQEGQAKATQLANATTEKGRQLGHDGQVAGSQLANVTMEKGKELAQEGQAKGAQLSSKARQAAHNAETSAENAANSGRQTASDVSARTRDTASNLSGSAVEHLRNLQHTGANAANETSGAAKSALDNTKQYVGARSGNANDMTSNSQVSTGNSGASDESHPTATIKPAKAAAPLGSAGRDLKSDTSRNTASSLPVQNVGGTVAGYDADLPEYVAARHAAASHAVHDRSNVAK